MTDIFSTFAAAAQSTELSYKIITKLIETYRKYKAHGEYWKEVDCIVNMYLGILSRILAIIESSEYLKAECNPQSKWNHIEKRYRDICDKIRNLHGDQERALQGKNRKPSQKGSGSTTLSTAKRRRTISKRLQKLRFVLRFVPKVESLKSQLYGEQTRIHLYLQALTMELLVQSRKADDQVIENLQFIKGQIDALPQRTKPLQDDEEGGTVQSNPSPVNVHSGRRTSAGGMVDRLSGWLKSIGNRGENRVTRTPSSASNGAPTQGPSGDAPSSSEVDLMSALSSEDSIFHTYVERLCGESGSTSTDTGDNASVAAQPIPLSITGSVLDKTEDDILPTAADNGHESFEQCGRGSRQSTTATALFPYFNILDNFLHALEIDDAHDSYASEIVLDLCSQSANRAPEKVDFRTLLNITHVVSEKGFHPRVQSQVRRWIAALNQPTPGTMSAELVTWIWISYVFRLPDEFRAFTATAQYSAKGPISRYNGYKVLLPGHVMDRIDEGRSAAIADFQKFFREQKANMAIGERNSRAAIDAFQARLRQENPAKSDLVTVIAEPLGTLTAHYLAQALVVGFLQAECCGLGICMGHGLRDKYSEPSIEGIHAYINTMVDLGRWMVSEVEPTGGLLSEDGTFLQPIDRMLRTLTGTGTPQVSAQCPVTLKQDLIQIAESQKRSMGLELPHYLLN